MRTSTFCRTGARCCCRWPPPSPLLIVDSLIFILLRVSPIPPLIREPRLDLASRMQDRRRRNSVTSTPAVSGIVAAAVAVVAVAAAEAAAASRGAEVGDASTSPTLWNELKSADEPSNRSEGILPLRKLDR